jgi:predicted transcriptional regulator
MMNWDLISFVIRSKYRSKILEKLKNNPSIPSKMSYETNISLSHVSRALNEMENKGLIQKLTYDHKGKIYGITEKGLEVLREIESKNLKSEK